MSVKSSTEVRIVTPAGRVYARYEPAYLPSHKRPLKCWQIVDCYVAKDRRGKGVGHRLMLALILKVTELQDDSPGDLVTAPGGYPDLSRSQVRAWYRRQGFRVMRGTGGVFYQLRIAQAGK